MRGLKRRVNEAKGSWVEQLPHVLWAYRKTPHSTTGETQFKMVFNSEVVIPVEIKESTLRIINLNLNRIRETSKLSLISLMKEERSSS